MFRRLFGQFLIITAVSVLSVAARAHNTVVVVPLGGGDFKPQNPLIIPAEEFREQPFNGSGDVVYGGGFWTGVPGQPFGCIDAPVYLPNGVRITRVEAVVLDNDSLSLSDITVNLVSIGNTQSNAGDTVTLASFSTSGRSFSYQTIADDSIVTPSVDTATKSYQMSTCFISEKVRFVSARIFFNQ